ncbi:MAG: HD domain-containing protein [Proteobacteria bacterium]|nr:HD domain-containing protein [Pseudomonadota bacterium]
MKHGTREDYLLLRELEGAFLAGIADRVLATLGGQEAESYGGYRVSRFTHGLQCATRAWRDGADLDWVVAALLHDIGDGLAPLNHDVMAAAVLRPYVREQVAWCVEHHGLFQMVYYAEHYGWDPQAREAHRASPYFDDCAEFCERWDQASFDPAYPSLPLAHFTPMVREMFARPAWQDAVLRPGERVPLADPAAALARGEPPARRAQP